MTLFGGDIYSITDEMFDAFWLSGPWRKLGKKEAYKHFRKTVKTEEDFQRITLARDNYAKDLKENPRQLLHGSTFFNNWEDYATLAPAVDRLNGEKHGKYAAFVFGRKG